MTASSAPAPATPDLVQAADEAARDVSALVAEATRQVRARVAPEGRVSAERLEAEQHAAHGLAWLATYAEGIRQLAAYAARMRDDSRLGETEELLVRIGVGEYLDQIFGGIAMS